MRKRIAGITSFIGGESLVRLVVARLAERVAQPLQTLVETVTGGSAGGLDVLDAPSANVARALFVG